MVDFGKKLLERRVEEWEEYYLDYGRLKSLIKKMAKAKKRKKKQEEEAAADTTAALQQHKHRATGSSSRSRTILDRITPKPMGTSDRSNSYNILDRVPTMNYSATVKEVVSEEYVTVLEFRQILDHEIQKLVLFVLGQEGKLADRLYDFSKTGQVLKFQTYSLVQNYKLQQHTNNNHNNSSSNNHQQQDTVWNNLDSLTTAYRDFARDLLQFVNFIDTNITGLRKILKKHDKNFPHHQLSGKYLAALGSGRRDNFDFDPANNDELISDNIQHHPPMDTHLNRLYYFGGVSTLVVTLSRAFDSLHLLEMNLLTLTDAAKNATQHKNHRRNISTPPLLSSYTNSPVPAIRNRATATATAVVDATTPSNTVTSSQYGSISTSSTNRSTTRRHSRTISAGGAMIDGGAASGEDYDPQYDTTISPVRSYKETPTTNNRKLPMIPSSGGPTNALSQLTITNKPPTGSSHARSSSPKRTPTNSSGVGIAHHAATTMMMPRRPTHLLTTTITRAHEPILDKIKEARSRLRQTTKYAELVAAQALIFDVDDDDDSKQAQMRDKNKTPVDQFTTVQRISSMLNLGSTFLYMMNYYVVAPTVGDYAIRLGSDESMSGIIIGMTPNAALVATVLYGYWSNYSYRNALIFAACSCICGNFLYGLALSYNSIYMVLCGRFLIGFGSARSINRRYIADVFSKADRTAASAEFVTYAAFGMAAGPGAAFGLGHVYFNNTNLLWSDVTAPGWIMSIIWSIFLIIFIAFFQEPDRIGLSVPKTDSTNSLRSNLSSKSAEIEGVRRDNTNNGGSGSAVETEPLLIQIDDEGRNNNPKETPLYKNVAVMVSLWLYFVLKLVLEMLMSSTGTVTKHYFGWDSGKSGLFMAVVAMLMFPVNLGVSRLSQQYEDRELITVGLIVMLISVLGILDYFPSYSVFQYMFFAIGIFVSANSLEGVNMSFLSKTIPQSWSRGTFNSGFLATEAGTLARSAGDVLISTVAATFGMNLLLNGLFTPMALLCIGTLVMVYFSYNQMVEKDDDDDDDDDDETDAGSIVSVESGRSKQSK